VRYFLLPDPNEPGIIPTSDSLSCTRSVAMSKAEDEFHALRQLAKDYRSVVDGLKARGWIEEHQEPRQGLVTSTELAPPQSDAGYIAINFDIHPGSIGDANNTVTVQLVTKRPDDDRIKVFRGVDVVRAGPEHALESFSAIVIDYANELEK
jgi:hypothetical protein